MSSLSSIILWFVRGLWPIISERVEQYGAAVTVLVSVAVVRYQHLPRKAEWPRRVHIHACTRKQTQTKAGIIYDSFEFRVSRLSRALLPIFVLGERGIEWLLSNGCIVSERMDCAFPHGRTTSLTFPIVLRGSLNPVVPLWQCLGFVCQGNATTRVLLLKTSLTAEFSNEVTRFRFQKNFIRIATL